LATQKRADLILFKEVVNLMNQKKHLEKEGLQQIVNLKASINKDLSPELNAAFLNTILVPRPLIENQVITNPN
jgi:hypothetical protein